MKTKRLSTPVKAFDVLLLILCAMIIFLALNQKPPVKEESSLDKQIRMCLEQQASGNFGSEDCGE